MPKLDHVVSPAAEAAALYARFGLPVIRVHRVNPDGTCGCGRPSCWQGERPSAGKHPDMGAAWQTKATADPAAAAALFTPPKDRHNVGVVCSHASGLVMLDVDTAYGEELIARLAGGDLPPTPEFRTARGRRLIYRNTSGVRLAERSERNADASGGELSTEAFGVLVGDGVQSVMPPSVHHTGARYEWAPGRGLGDVPIAPAPAWLVEYAADAKQAEAPPEPAGGADSPMADFNRRADWQALLGAAGWTRCHRRADGMEYWTRPGKGGGTSATLGFCTARDGTPALCSFSGSVPYLAPKRPVDKFGFYARWKHGGDFRAAAVALQTDGFDGQRYGKRPPAAAGCTNATRNGATADGSGSTAAGGGAGLIDPCTDMSNAKAFAAEHGGGVRYCHPHKCWYVHDGRRWAKDESGAVVDMAKRTAAGLLRRAADQFTAAAQNADPDAKAAARNALRWAVGSQQANRLDAMLRLAQSEPGLVVLPEQFDADPWALNVENGTVDLRTGVLRPHRREDLLTCLAPVEYHQDAPARPGRRSWPACSTATTP